MSTCFESKKPVQLLLQLTEAKLESIKRYCKRIFSFFVGELEQIATPYHENRGLKQAMNFRQYNSAGFTEQCGIIVLVVLKNYAICKNKTPNYSNRHFNSNNCSAS